MSDPSDVLTGETTCVPTTCMSRPSRTGAGTTIILDGEFEPEIDHHERSRSDIHRVVGPHALHRARTIPHGLVVILERGP